MSPRVLRPLLVAALGLLLFACGPRKIPPRVAYEADHESSAVELSIELVEYEVSGDTPAALRAAMSELGPRGDDGTAYDGYARWHLRWRYGYDKDSESCAPASPRVSVALYYTMPQAATSQEWTPALSRRWSRYLDALWAHELGHGELAIDYAEALQLVLLDHEGATSCGELDEVLSALGQSYLAALREEQSAYDLETDHGRKDGAVWP